MWNFNWENVFEKVVCKMVATILQTTFVNAFSWEKFLFCIKNFPNPCPECVNSDIVSRESSNNDIQIAHQSLRAEPITFCLRLHQILNTTNSQTLPSLTGHEKKMAIDHRGHSGIQYFRGVVSVWRCCVTSIGFLITEITPSLQYNGNLCAKKDSRYIEMDPWVRHLNKCIIQ